jgi:hypothetical protein
VFKVYLMDQAQQQLGQLQKNRSLQKRYKAIRFLATNPRHPSLQTHEFTSLLQFERSGTNPRGPARMGRSEPRSVICLASNPDVQILTIQFTRRLDSAISI